MLPSYNKLIFLDIDGGLDGLVGKKYPGSTGGEIFNYYGTDSNANEASGTYSTASGYNNKARGNYSFVVGMNNSTGDGGLYSAGNGTFIAGRDNYRIRGIALGYNNRNGFTNTGIDRIFIGDHLTGVRKHGEWGEASSFLILGKYNEQELHLEGNDGVVVVGCGKDTNNKKTALEISNTECKILNNLQLATDTTKVNAIVPPSDPNNITADDQTLATKAYADAISANLPMKHLTSAITGLSETSFPLDFTSYWSAARATDVNMKISIRINGVCYMKYLFNCLAVDGNVDCYRYVYDSVNQITTFYRYMFNWDYTNKAFNLVGAMSWQMNDSGTISNVSHNVTGMTITIYQIETY